MEGENPSLTISISGTPEQRHLGFEVVDQCHTSIYHLAFHCRFFKHSPAEYLRCSPQYMRVELANFTPHEKLHIYRHLETLYARGSRKIPYGFNYVADSVLTADGDVAENLPPGSGLTCATFVLQVFRNQSFDIIDIDSWKSRDDDGAWQAKILDDLKIYSDASEAHLEALKEHIGKAARFRPEEVAGCARDFDEESIEFPEGVRLGQEVYQEMRNQGFL